MFQANILIDLKVQTPLTNRVLNKLSPRQIAEQLTLYDAELFIKVIPSECLNYVRHRSAKSVDATIKQFNRIYGFVLTTIIEADYMTSTPSNDVSGASLASLTLSIINVPLRQDWQRHTNFDGRSSALARLTSSLSSGQDLDSMPCGDSFLRAEILAKWISVAAVRWHFFIPHTSPLISFTKVGLEKSALAITILSPRLLVIPFSSSNHDFFALHLITC